MPKVAPVNLAYNVRTLWFDPQDVEVHAGDNVVVQTKRGIELGRAASEIIEVEEERIAELKSPLQPLLRIATEEDLEQAKEMERLSKQAMDVFKELARETSEDMHPVSVEYLLDGDKAVFYFESEERIDFRDLVRQLASRFHVRIDMRQIGVRDEARIVGGLAHCGQEVCCKRLGGEFNPVSIRMAKDQDLSLNPQKVSGLCGRLMCCLRYENDVYKEFKSEAPKMGATVQTPDGPAKVTDFDVPRGTVTLTVEDEKPVKVPLSDFEPAEEGKRPSVVNEEAWLDAKEADEYMSGIGIAYQITQFTGNDKLGDARAIHHTSEGRKRSAVDASGSDADKVASDETSKSSGKRRRKTEEPEKLSSKTDASRKPRRRKSTTISGGAKTASASDVSGGGMGGSAKAGNAKSNNAKSEKQGTVRPGQRSSGLAQVHRKQAAEGSANKLEEKSKQERGKSGDTHRRRRRRSTKANSKKDES